MKVIIGPRKDEMPVSISRKGKRSKIEQTDHWQEMRTAVLNQNIKPHEILGYWLIEESDKKQFGKQFRNSLLRLARKEFRDRLKLPLDIYWYATAEGDVIALSGTPITGSTAAHEITAHRTPKRKRA